MATIIDQYFDGVDEDTFNLRQTSSAYPKLAIEFVPSVTASCNQVILTLRKSGTIAGGNIWTEVWSDNGSDLPNVQLGIDSATITANNLGGTAAEVTFVFSTPIALTSGIKYWIVFDGDYAVDGSNYIGWFKQDTTAYAYYLGFWGGSSWSNSAASVRCLNFKEYYDSTTTTSTSTSSSTSTTTTSISTSTSTSSSTSVTETTTSISTTSISTTSTSISTTTTSISTSTTSTSTTTIYFEPELLEVYDITGEVSS